MPGIDFRALRSEVGMDAVLKLLGFVPVQRRAGQVRGPCPVHSPKGAIPLVFREPGATPIAASTAVCRETSLISGRRPPANRSIKPPLTYVQN